MQQKTGNQLQNKWKKQSESIFKPFVIRYEKMGCRMEAGIFKQAQNHRRSFKINEFRCFYTYSVLSLWYKYLVNENKKFLSEAKNCYKKFIFVQINKIVLTKC